MWSSCGLGLEGMCDQIVAPGFAWGYCVYGHEGETQTGVLVTIFLAKPPGMGEPVLPAEGIADPQAP